MVSVGDICPRGRAQRPPLGVVANGGAGGVPYVVFTGGEPSLQLDDALVAACHNRGFEVAIETNGTRPLAAGIDWICVSPKPRSELVIRTGHELKFVYPQPELSPHEFATLNFKHWFINPWTALSCRPTPRRQSTICQTHLQWRPFATNTQTGRHSMTVQTHSRALRATLPDHANESDHRGSCP